MEYVPFITSLEIESSLEDLFLLMVLVFSTVVGDYINTMKTTFFFKFDC